MQTQRNRSIRICFTGLAAVGALSLGACGASDAADTATPDAVNDTVTAGEAPTASAPEPSNSEPDAPDDVDDATVAEEVAPDASGQGQRASVMIDGAALEFTDGTCFTYTSATDQLLEGFFTGADGSTFTVTWSSETIGESAITYTDAAESFQWVSGPAYVGSGDLDVVLGDGGTATVSGRAIDIYATDRAPVDVVVDMQCQDGL
jgi:hypothetical protein